MPSYTKVNSSYSNSTFNDPRSLIKFKGKRSDSISSFEFENGDIQREEVIKEILDIYCSF